ncbi:hypothetical protein [Mesorhizobium sp.]|nr:hypothetical protein [Mesorhizobium sp.]
MPIVVAKPATRGCELASSQVRSQGGLHFGAATALDNTSVDP